MLIPTSSTNPALDETIRQIHLDMSTMTCDTKEYASAADQLIKLYKLREDLTRPHRLSPDVLVPAIANILGIVAILKYEKYDIITTKALGFVMKAR